MWLQGTSLTQAVFVGAAVGHSYSFYSQATDLVGNVEAAAPSAQATTSIIERKSVDVTEVSIVGDPVSGVVVQFADALDVQSLIDSGAITSAVTLSSTTEGAITLTPSEFTYDATAHRMTITLATTLGPGIYQLRLDGSVFHGADDALLRGGAAGLIFQLEAFDAARNIQVAGEDLFVSAAAVPSLVDWNGDGTLDLLVGERTEDRLGKIRVYLNQGTNQNPLYGAFSYVQTPDGDLSVPSSDSFGVFPKAYDWNGDGEDDLVLGLADGTIQVWTNVNTPSDPIFALPRDVNYGPSEAKSTINVGAGATAAITDWNGDGRADLLVGGFDGRVRLYLDGATSGAPDFATQSIIQDGPGDLIVPSGRVSVSVADLDGDGRKDLILGNADGEMLFYRNMGTNAAPVFNGSAPILADGQPIHIPDSPRTRPFIGDFNADGAPDLLVGTLDGQVRLYQGQGIAPSSGTILGAAGEGYTFTFVANRGLTATDDQYATNTNASLSVDALHGVLANDSAGLDPAPSVVLVGSGTEHGRLVLNSDGSFTYTPDPGYSGSDGFQYALTRGQEQSNIATVLVLVSNTSSNTPMVSLEVSAATSIYGTPLTFAVTVSAASPGLSTPTGMVEFFDGSVLLDRQLLDGNGQAASKPIVALGAGVHSITATYLGDERFSRVSSAESNVDVFKATLTVTVESFTRVYGRTSPAPTWTFTGFVNGDSPLSSGITGQPNVFLPDVTSPVGDYPITIQVGGLISPNYDFQVNPDRNEILTITPALLTITADNQVMFQGGALPHLTVNYDGFVNGDGPSSLSPAVQINTQATSSSSAGLYPIIPSGAGSVNYAITYRPGTLSVLPPANPRPLQSGYGIGRDRFVIVLFQKILGRDPSFGELTSWSRKLALGMKASRVAASVWRSPEHRQLVRLGADPGIPLARAYRVAMAAGRRAVQFGNTVPEGPLALRSYRLRPVPVRADLARRNMG